MTTRLGYHLDQLLALALERSGGYGRPVQVNGNRPRAPERLHLLAQGRPRLEYKGYPVGHGSLLKVAVWTMLVTMITSMDGDRYTARHSLPNQ